MTTTLLPTFKDRVNYAARIIRERRDTSRKFDGCFEEGDGDAVVLALVKRAEGCPKLKQNLPRYVAESSIAKARAELFPPTTYRIHSCDFCYSPNVFRFVIASVRPFDKPKAAELFAALGLPEEVAGKLAESDPGVTWNIDGDIVNVIVNPNPVTP